MLAILRRLLRPLKWLILAVLAFNAFYFTLGLFDGVFHFPAAGGWGSVALERVYPSRTKSFHVQMLADLEQLVTKPYGVPKITVPLEWWKRLGLVRGDVPRGGGSYRQLWDSQAMYRRAGGKEESKNWHHWIYLSGDGGGKGSPKSTSEWDEAFDSLVQYHAVHPPANDARFHQVSCARNSLCRLLVTRAPALIHFTTALPVPQRPVRADGNDRRWSEYEQVYMRIIELPISTGALRLAPGVFPSPFNQLLSLTCDPDAWMPWKPQWPLSRLLSYLRMTSWRRAAEYPFSYGLLYNLDRRVLPPAVSGNSMSLAAYTAGWLTSLSAQFLFFLGPVPYMDAVHELYRGVFQRTQIFRDPNPSSHKLDGAQSKAMEDLVVTFLSCDGDVGKVREIPEVRQTLEKMRRSLPKESRKSIDGRIESARQEGCGLKQAVLEL